VRIAAIDTSTRSCGVALLETDGGSGPLPAVVAEAAVLARDSHTARLLPLLEALLDQVGWPRDRIDLFAAARGPGSFTGLRIGLGTIRGLALAAGKPCVGVGALDALAEAHGAAEAMRVPILDAGRGEVYAACFDPTSSPPEIVREPWVGPPGGLAERIEGPAVLFGPGLDPRVLSVGPSVGVRWASAPRAVAAAVGRLALAALEAGDPDALAMAPLYVRPPDAVARPRER